MEDDKPSLWDFIFAKKALKKAADGTPAQAAPTEQTPAGVDYMKQQIEATMAKQPAPVPAAAPKKKDPIYRNVR